MICANGEALAPSTRRTLVIRPIALEFCARAEAGISAAHSDDLLIANLESAASFDRPAVVATAAEFCFGMRLSQKGFLSGMFKLTQFRYVAEFH
jgi:hypothetical protein